MRVAGTGFGYPTVMTNTPTPGTPTPTRPFPDLPDEPEPMPAPGDPPSGARQAGIYRVRRPDEVDVPH